VWVVIASKCDPPNSLALSQSKECQTLSWKASHKANCIPNPTVAALNGTKPDNLKFSTEWAELEVDKLLSKWMAEWRQCFMHWTTLALVARSSKSSSEQSCHSLVCTITSLSFFHQFAEYFQSAYYHWTTSSPDQVLQKLQWQVWALSYSSQSFTYPPKLIITFA